MIMFMIPLATSVNRHAPFKKLSPKEIKIKNKPWLSHIIVKMIKNRNKVFARKKRQPNNENLKRLYNILRNRVKRDIKKTKKQWALLNRAMTHCEPLRPYCEPLRLHYETLRATASHFNCEPLRLHYETLRSTASHFNPTASHCESLQPHCEPL